MLASTITMLLATLLATATLLLPATPMVTATGGSRIVSKRSHVGGVVIPKGRQAALHLTPYQLSPPRKRSRRYPKAAVLSPPSHVLPAVTAPGSSLPVAELFFHFDFATLEREYRNTKRLYYKAYGESPVSPWEWAVDRAMSRCDATWKNLQYAVHNIVPEFARVKIVEFKARYITLVKLLRKHMSIDEKVVEDVMNELDKSVSLVNRWTPVPESKE